MINKKLIAVALAAATMGLASCGTKAADSRFGADDLETASGSISKDVLDLQITGSAWDWKPEQAKEEQLFKVVNEGHTENSFYTLTIEIKKDTQYKFTFNHGWNSDFGYGKVDWKSAGVSDEILAANVSFQDADKVKEGDDLSSKNIIALKDATYTFEYNKFGVALEGWSAACRLKSIA